ncbi:uncharacterized protein LOC115786528 [Archocentrus centrarchus]|uniref:uncharacterized protein LOC115786528 n=1 Tax=Archocentrus centrarchus TaxID=63155 RepID=UPI0011E9C846|nr:uncharacterized protein LOC115786528 [Archocentrus centrarchus]
MFLLCPSLPLNFTFFSFFYSSSLPPSLLPLFFPTFQSPLYFFSFMFLIGSSSLPSCPPLLSLPSYLLSLCLKSFFPLLYILCSALSSFLPFSLPFYLATDLPSSLLFLPSLSSRLQSLFSPAFLLPLPSCRPPPPSLLVLVLLLIFVPAFLQDIIFLPSFSHCFLSLSPSFLSYHSLIILILPFSSHLLPSVSIFLSYAFLFLFFLSLLSFLSLHLPIFPHLPSCPHCFPPSLPYPFLPSFLYTFISLPSYSLFCPSLPLFLSCSYFVVPSLHLSLFFSFFFLFCPPPFLHCSFFLPSAISLSLFPCFQFF